ncbi:MAG TPA: zf-HC2 domain-containing protein, partial [Myxococcales bacterium]
MNCAESQDLLLDLAYRELPPARAAEVEAHVLGCAACRAEMAQLDDARKAAAPLRELEEPPAGFDEPILRAARAEAGLQADGTPGPVVEVSASVKPLGLQAARLDPHARMRGGTARPGPRWGRRAAVFGSIAAAAGLAVVVSSSLTRPSAPPNAEEVAPIQVRAPGTVPSSLDDALATQGKAAAPETKGAAPSREIVRPPPARAQEPAHKRIVNAPAPAKEKTARPDQQAPSLLLKKEADQEAERSEERYQPLHRAVEAPGEGGIEGGIEGGTPGGTAGGTVVPPPASPKAAAEPSPGGSRPAAAVRSSTDSQTLPAALPRGAVIAQQKAAAPNPDQAARPDPDQIEDQASAARRRGDYARAAALYREASALRGQSEPARAAWDMAHAVECLAAGGQVNEAVAVR